MVGGRHENRIYGRLVGGTQRQREDLSRAPICAQEGSAFVLYLLITVPPVPIKAQDKTAGRIIGSSFFVTFTLYGQENRQTILRRSNDGLHGPARTLLSPADFSSRRTLHGDGNGERGYAW